MLDLSFRPNLPPLLRGGPDDVYTLTHYKHFVFGSETSKDAYNYVDIGVFVDTLNCIRDFDSIGIMENDIFEFGSVAKVFALS